MSANVDPLSTPSTLMRVTGVMNMVLSGLATLWWCLLGIVAHSALVFAVISAAAFIASFQVFSAGRAMEGRYTLKHCQLASVLALVSGPLGLVAGITSLVTLRRPEVRATFNS